VVAVTDPVATVDGVRKSFGEEGVLGISISRSRTANSSF